MGFGKVLFDRRNCLEEEWENLSLVFKVESEVMSELKGFFISQFFCDMDLIRLGDANC